MVPSPGWHTIYIDAKTMVSHIPQGEYPAWVLSLILYIEGGIRSAAIGSVIFGRQPDGSEKAAAIELVRLAIPRRVYTHRHVDYLAEVSCYVHKLRSDIRGVDIVEAPEVLQLFTARFEPAHGALIAS